MTDSAVVLGFSPRRRVGWKSDRAPWIDHVLSASTCRPRPPHAMWGDPLRNAVGLYPDEAAMSSCPLEDVGPWTYVAYRSTGVWITPEGQLTDAAAVLPEVRADPIPPTYRRAGFDVVALDQTGFACAPLTCSDVLLERGSNAFGLFDTFEEAVTEGQRFARTHGLEPPPYLVVEVLERASEDAAPPSPSA